MCGLAGFYDPVRSEEEAKSVLTKMGSQLGHRGPDDQGIWFDPATGVGLAHRRLAVIDLSARGHQPMCSASGRYVIVFNGEIYNYRELRTLLEGRGISWQGYSDTEVFLAAVEVWGVYAALQRCVGMFALTLWDRKTRVFYLARDRLGEKPLYYGWMNRVFLFGSELKALRVHPAWQGEIDREALTLFMRHNYIPTPYSIYQGIYKLSPGCVLALNWEALRQSKPLQPFPAKEKLGQIAPVAYWSLWEVAEKGRKFPFISSEVAAINELESRLREVIDATLVADVPVGAFLSGGIDSSTVVALMQVACRQPVRTFSIGFYEQGYNEATYAARVARHLGTAHTELYVSADEALAVIPHLSFIYDEPFADSSQIPTFLVAKLARGQVTVALSGDGGDELFGGYNRYFWCRQIWGKLSRIPPAVRRLAAQCLSMPAPSTWDRAFSSAGTFLPVRLQSGQPGDKLHKLAAIFCADSPAAVYRLLVSQWQNPSDVVVDGTESSPLFDKVWSDSALTDFTERMMLLDLMTFLPDDILVKVDRASMAVSLETRIPLLNHRLIEFAWRLPLKLNVRDGAGKWALRQILRRYVPKELVERPKMGFGVPIDAWLRGPLRSWAEDLLAEGKLHTEGFFNPAPIRKKWEEHLSGRRNWQYPLWCVLMFQSWWDAQ
jgi:asparagine synthase (glutamine-hydrolysing)